MINSLVTRTSARALIRCTVEFSSSTRGVGDLPAPALQQRCQQRQLHSPRMITRMRR
ncbi:hypothetical protein [Nocardia farcinica]|uniref:hypothetical protein n=1 Tax=Nocardia farcinica TaxID=37329 RepID=UPI002453D257|nr:hypothetical protein [Nocardia farcinica]